MKRVKVNDVELAYRDEGTSGGASAPLVLLHAFPLSQRMWEEQVAAFAARFAADWLRSAGG